MPRVRVVIDTNVVLSSLLFANGGLAALRHAWQRGGCVPLVSRATAEELIAVLAYPKFKLTHAQQQDALAAYLPYCETFATPRASTTLPICRDVHDQKFIALAHAAKADALITEDKDLLVLRSEYSIGIVMPIDWISKQLTD